jgi:hypothetical protein
MPAAVPQAVPPWVPPMQYKHAAIRQQAAAVQAGIDLKFIEQEV